MCYCYKNSPSKIILYVHNQKPPKHTGNIFETFWNFSKILNECFLWGRALYEFFILTKVPLYCVGNCGDILKPTFWSTLSFTTQTHYCIVEVLNLLNFSSIFSSNFKAITRISWDRLKTRSSFLIENYGSR